MFVRDILHTNYASNRGCEDGARAEVLVTEQGGLVLRLCDPILPWDCGKVKAGGIMGNQCIWL